MNNVSDNTPVYVHLAHIPQEPLNIFSLSSADTCDSEQIINSSSYKCPGGPERSESTWCSIFPAGNIFSKDFDSWSGSENDAANYWLAESGKIGEDQGFTIFLGCNKTVVGVNLRNTQNADFNDRSTKKFRIFGSVHKNGPWQELLVVDLVDSRRQNPPPLQQLMFPNSAVVSFVKFELLDYYGSSGGLQFFEVTVPSNQRVNYGLNRSKVSAG